MASSQVEIASSSPFGCVLRDHNRQDRCRDSSNASRVAFEKNLKALVRDHLNNCVSLSADSSSSSSSNENSKNQMDIDSWVDKEYGNNRRILRSLRLKTNNNHEDDNNNNNKSEYDSLPISPRHARILDRWAAKQAKKMVSTIERQSQEAEPSQENPETATDIANLGASSLVQIWEARLNRSNSMNMNLNPSASSSRTSSSLSYNENASYVEEPSRGSENGDSVDERTINEDSLTDWESQSDRTALSEPPPSSLNWRNSDDVESERVKVSDIIRRLQTSGSEDNNDHELGNESPRERRPSSVSSDQAEQRGISQVVNSPKIRGRQAFSDLLMQMERDRHRELDSLVQRQAVSRFAQRGRIQSLLRLSFLQRGMAIRDQQRPQSSTEVKQKPQGSAIMLLRERFNAGIEQGTTAQSDANSPRNPARETVNNTVHLDNSSTPNQLREDSRHQDASTTVQQSIPPVEHSVPQTSEEHEKEASPSSNVTRQGPSLEDSYRYSQEAAETAVSLNVWDENEIAEEQEANDQQHLYRDTQETAETTASLNSWNENEIAEEQEANDQQHLYLEAQETAETTASYPDWDENEIEEEEQEVDHQQSDVGISYDWFSDIARPQSYWEDLRQERYQEVLLSTSSENEEMRRLLVSRTVSSFLASDFRERMDRLMISRVQRQPDLESSQEGEQDEEGSQERIDQLMLSYLQQHLNPPASTNQEEEEQEEERDEGEVVEAEEEEEDDDDDDDDDEEEEMQEVEEEEEVVDGEEGSQISHQYHEASDYFDQSSSSMQMRSPSFMRSWSYRDSEVGNRIVPTSPHQPLPSPSYYRDCRQFSSSTSRPLIEMELIYDLRGHMEQLQSDMSELRKCMMSCMDMQVKLQQSIQQEAHSGQGERKNSLDRSPRKRSCCICYEMQVDSLLYRCGHMCTCLKCAHELQWSSGKCPICRAPIVDVVRAYMDS